MDTAEKKTWSVSVLNIDWRADRHEEGQCVEFQRPTADNPHPEFPVVAGEELSNCRLSMSSEWGRLFDRVVVKTFDEASLTVLYGKREIVLRPGQPWVKLGTGGMNYPTFWYFVGVK